MTIQEFKAECRRVMGGCWTAERDSWTVDYLLATLRHHGPQGDALRLRALAGGL